MKQRCASIHLYLVLSPDPDDLDCQAERNQQNARALDEDQSIEESKPLLNQIHEEYVKHLQIGLYCFEL